MNLQSMDYFVALAEERSFTRAAERIGITQQTLSAHVANVERELGVKLVRRSVPIALTASGEKFLGYARRFQALRRSMEQEFRDIAGDRGGVLSVGIASTRGHMLMPDAIAAFQERFPDITVMLREGENDELVELLKEGRIDMAIATMPLDVPQLVVERLYRERVVLVVAQSLLDDLYGERVEQVVDQVQRTGSLRPMADCPYLLLGERDVPGDLSRSEFERAGFSPKVKAFSTNSETLVALAERGVGAVFCPEEMVGTIFAGRSRGDLRTITLSDRASFWISVAWKRSEHVWSAIGEFRDVLREQPTGASNAIMS